MVSFFVLVKCNHTFCRKLTCIAIQSWSTVILICRSLHNFTSKFYHCISIILINFLETRINFLVEEWVEEKINKLFVTVSIHQDSLGGVIKVTENFVFVSKEDHLGINMTISIIFSCFSSSNFNDIVTHFTGFVTTCLRPVDYWGKNSIKPST